MGEWQTESHWQPHPSPQLSAYLERGERANDPWYHNRGECQRDPEPHQQCMKTPQDAVSEVACPCQLQPQCQLERVRQQPFYEVIPKPPRTEPRVPQQHPEPHRAVTSAPREVAQEPRRDSL